MLHLHSLQTQQILVHKTFSLLARKWLKAHSSVFMLLHAPIEQKVYKKRPTSNISERVV